MFSGFQQLEERWEGQAAAVWGRGLARDCWLDSRKRVNGAGVLRSARGSTRESSSLALRLGGESDRALRRQGGESTSKPAGFIDLGDLRSSGSRFEVRLELGGGVILSIARG